MEKFNAYQIEQFLKIEREIIGSADHHEIASKGNIWGDGGDTVSSISITTSFAAGN